MTVNELWEKLGKARERGYGEGEITVIAASSGNPDHHHSAMLPIISTAYIHDGMHVVHSNYVAGYIDEVFPERAEA